MGINGHNESSDAGSCHFKTFWLFFIFLFTTDTNYKGARAPKKRAQHVKFRPRNEHFKIKEITFSKCSKNIVFEQNPHISTSFQYFF